MAEPNVLQGDWYFTGTLSPTKFNPPSSSIDNAAIKASAGIDASKIIHRHSVNVELFGPAVTITALTKLLHIAHAAGTLVAFKAFLITNPTGADRTVSVDLQKSTAGGAFATVLTTKAEFTDTSVDRTVVAAVIATTAYIAGDLFQVVVTVAGAAGAQALGLHATMMTSENPT